MLRARALVLVTVSACAVDPTIAPDDDDPGDPPGDSCAARDVLVQRCGAMAAQGYVALGERPHGLTSDLVVVDPANGSTCPVVDFTPASSVHSVTAAAAVGTDVFYCAATGFEALGPLTRVSILDGTVTTSAVLCRSIAAHDGKLAALIDIGSPLKIYTSFADVLSDTSAPLPIPECSPRLGSGDDKLYTAWPTLATVSVFEPRTNLATRFMVTETVEVWGLVARSGRLSVIDSLRGSVQHLFAFDAATGTMLDKVLLTPPRPDLAVLLHGLADPCAGPAPMLN